ncbi:MAG: hypothetical protein AB7H77_01565 [Bdellovibrionales bacterium]
MQEIFQRLQEQPKSFEENGWEYSSMLDSAIGLTVTVKKNKKQIEIEFSDVVGFRCLLEETQSSFWPRFHSKKNGSGLIYTVNNSEWLKSFNEADMIHYKSAQHYLIVTAQKRIDVLAVSPPTFT